MTFFIFCIHVLGPSSIMGSINIIATVMNMRAPGMTYMKMPLFVWTWLITAFLLVAVMPVLAGAVTMMLMDVHFGTSFFSAAGGGDPVLFQHVFWFFGHPEVYIIILPAFGVVSQIIPTFSRKPLFGYNSMVYATASIAFLSFIVWAHHMYTVGMPVAGELYFMLATMLIAVPTGVKVFNWVTTMFKGSMTFETPMLFAIAFVFLFTVGGLSGVMLAMAPVDFQYHDTYFVVAHFHYTMVAGAIFSMSASVYYWLPKWCGKMYNEGFDHEQRPSSRHRALRGIDIPQPCRDAEVRRHAAHEKARFQAGVFEDPGQHRGGGGLAVGAGHRQHMPAAQQLLRQPLRAAGVGQPRVEDRLHQGVARRAVGQPRARDHVAHHPQVGLQGDLVGGEAFDEVDAQ